MNFKITEDMRKKIFVNVCSLAIPILFFVILDRFKEIKSFINTLLVICFPFIFGISLAFILYNPQKWIEEKIFAKTKMSKSKKRLLSTTLTFLFVIILMTFFCSIIIPNIFDSLQQFASNVSSYMDTFFEYITAIAASLNISPDMIQSMIDDVSIMEKITATITTTIPKLASYSYDFVKGLINFILAIVSGFYILMDREQLLHGIKRLTYSVLNIENAKFLNSWILDVKTVFEQYIVGNIIDSSIIGLICYLGTLALQIPYAPMIGLIVGITNLIPVFGPFLGAVPVIILLILINPISALVFAVFILILQQIDGNVIKPIVLGDKLGMSGFWILFSVTIGGGLFNVVGMFLGVPVFALIYSAVSEYSNIKLKEKHIEL